MMRMVAFSMSLNDHRLVSIHVVCSQNDDMHVTVGHTHSADAAAVDAANLKVKMQEQMRSVRAQPGAVLGAAVLGATNDVRAALGRTDHVKRSLRRCVNINIYIKIYLFI